MRRFLVRTPTGAVDSDQTQSRMLQHHGAPNRHRKQRRLTFDELGREVWIARNPDHKSLPMKAAKAQRCTDALARVNQ